MALLLSAIFDEAAAMLNDVAKTSYTNSVMLPFAKKAYNELEVDLTLNGVAVVNEISAPITVNANSLTISAPSDMSEPLALEERAVGQTKASDWIPMKELEWDQNVDPYPDRLYLWNYREEIINTPGCTQQRVVRIRYRKFLSAITGEGSTVPVNLAQTYMAERTAALCAFLLGEMETLGAALAESAEKSKNKLIAIKVRDRQHFGARRKPYKRFL